MFKTAAAKIAHNSTIPALAGNSDLRQFQDLINAEKVVLVSTQRLGVDITKAAESLRAWGVGEGDDLADILSASTTLLVNFAAALSAYASTHHGIRDTMKSVRTREEALDDLRRRRRRVGASADGAEKKLNKMSPEHKNLSAQTDALNRLREEMRAIDGEIVREESELGDYKRKCAKSWMQAKFGGLAECCEKGVIVGDIGKAIVAEIPEDVTQPGLPRAYYNGHPRVSAFVSEAQRGIAQVAFTTVASGRVSQGEYEHTSPTQTSSHMQERQSLSSSSPYLPVPHVGSRLHLSGFGSESLVGLNELSPSQNILSFRHSQPPPPPLNQRTASADEFGVPTPTSTHASHFASFPARGTSLGVLSHDAPTPSSPSLSYLRQADTMAPSALPAHDTSGSLTSSIADALARSDSNSFSLNRPSLDDPAPKYEPFVPGSGAPYTGVGDTRRSKSPSLPPGAAPAAIQAWDGGLGAEIEERRTVSESNDNAMSVMSGNEQPTSITGLSDRRTSQESVGGMPYDHDEEAEDDQSNEIVLQKMDQGVRLGTEEDETEEESNRPSPETTESQRRIPRVPPPPVDTEAPAPPDHTRIVSPPSLESTSPLQTQAKGHSEDSDGDDEQARNAAAAREVSRELDALAFSAPAPVTYSTHPTQSRAPPQGSYMSGQTYLPQPHQQLQSHLPQQVPNQTSRPPSPLAPPNAPFAHRSVSPHPHIGADPGESRPLPIITASKRRSSRSTSPRLPPSSLSNMQSSSSVSHRLPPEHPRPLPPFSSPLMTKSTSSLTSGAPGGAPRMISAAAFRRPGRNGSESLSLLRPSASPASSMSRKSGAMRRLSVVNPDPIQVDEDEFDYIAAYTGRDEPKSAPARQSGGYGQGRYVSDLESR
ncbi:uncharacterized protein F5891DRAFT_1043981 [Suillus fuscotomentosus]|uniref:Eisosome component PIL1-domain-containing protein n=1 Tax=Suillus fuscotomentosus TaxID=1912939 RepID=A0AAD4E205_9AGAM|nr:uncharacterized protein F5891DRAFT_1043981 [Suillus fuscotomentosus]KAG1898269.1 hypothetical protein F5891DRAFT_1043981 [Suillus fuscotomentosus]